MANVVEANFSSRRQERLQPQNLEAEQALLGAMLLSTEVVEGALSKVKREDFYRPSHGRVYSAMSDLQARSIPVDHLSVADRLEALDELEQLRIGTLVEMEHTKDPATARQIALHHLCETYPHPYYIKCTGVRTERLLLNGVVGDTIKAHPWALLLGLLVGGYAASRVLPE